MIPTLLGLPVVLAGLMLVLRGTNASALNFVLLMSLMGGSAALILPTLGGASIPPAYLALGFLLVRILLSSRTGLTELASAVKVNVFLVCYGAYGTITAFVLPRVFAGQLNVVPMRFTMLRTLLETAPLNFTSQNITTSVYLIGSTLAAIAAYSACIPRRSAAMLLKVGLWVAWIHACLGLLGAALAGTPAAQILNIFRNATYSQSSQSFDGIARIYGIFPEPSSYVTFGFPWFVFLFELWGRGVNPRQTGAAAAALGAVLLLSTSTTAYVSLACYCAVLFGRWAIGKGPPLRKAATIGVAFLAVATIAAGAAVLTPDFAASTSKMLSFMTVGKVSSTSGIQRSFWIRSAMDAFWYSRGLGVGVGSLRSSSLISATLGSTGVFGALMLGGSLLACLKPLRESTYAWRLPYIDAVGASLSWAALGVVIPLAVSGSSPDPGLTFGIFSGAAMALRRSGANSVSDRRSAGEHQRPGKGTLPKADVERAEL